MVLALFASLQQAWADEVDPTTHLKYTVSSGEVTVSGFDPDFTPPADYALVIPDEIADLPVVAVKDSAFYSRNDFVSLTIGKNVRTIGMDAFRMAKGMTNVTFAVDGALETIGVRAFRGCWFLEEVEVPPTVTTLSEEAFSYCYALTSASVPSSVASIGVSAFDNDTTMTSITIAPGATSIGHHAFRSCRHLTSFTVPSTVTTIGEYAFSWCTSLEEVTIPSSVTSIGNYIFYECSALRVVNLNCRNIPADIVSYKRNLESIVIGANVRTIGSAAFRGCTALTSVTFAPAGSLTTIGEQAFMDDTLLVSVTIPNTVTAIGDKVFWACTRLASVTFEDGFSMTYLPTSMFQACYALDGITIPSGITTLGDSVFYDCTSLSSITIPASVTSIGSSVFRNCTSLASATFADGCHITTIPSHCFRACYALGNVAIPSTVTSIADYAFDNCQSFTSISLPSGVTSIGEYAFRNCNHLTSFTIPSSVTSIGQMALSYLRSITSIEIPSSVKTVGQWVFNGCSNLATVTFAAGSRLTALSKYMFQDCTSLETITIPSSVTAIGYSPFKGCTSLESIVIPRTVASMDTYTFDGCTSLESVTFEEPSQITIIPNSAFQTCSALATITIPSSVTEIAPYAFNGCSSLDDIVIPGHVKTVNHRSFLDCSSLANLTIANGVESIGDLAFQGTALTSVTVPNSVSSLGNDLFNGCSSLMLIDMSRTERVAALYGLTTINRTSTGIFNGIPAACEVILPPYCRATGNHVTVSDPPAEGALTTAADGYYELYTANHWRLFSYIALGLNGWANARMMADIDLGDDQSRIGTKTMENSGWFRGTFDGQGHTLTVAYVEPGENECAPFNKINGATIRNLKVTGTIQLTGYGYHPAGIASASWGTSTIEHCWSDITIGGNGGDWREAGAIVGCHKSGTLTITDCLFTGSIAGSGGWNGCFVGYSNSGTLTQTNCLSTGSFSYPSSNRDFRGTHVNCYVKQYPVALVDGITRATDENLADGTVATALQAGRGDIVWVQDPDLNTPMLKLFASPLPPLAITAASATIWGEDRYVTSFYSGTTPYQLPEGSFAYTAELDGDNVVFYRIGDGSVIPAATAAIIVSDDSSITMSGLYSTAVTARGSSILLGSDTPVAVTEGKVEDKTPYVIGISGGVLGLYRFSGESIPAGKAYYLKAE